ncbi:hypothetical protein B0H13DRAFT_1933001 [Mycena leptocephala]|nr:hypothetical protein B0H13DRAFT_1933001 [Mycena leptocephala]
MVSFNLTPAEVASLVASHNHPGPLSADELERLVSHLTDAQMDEFVELLGLGELARQLPPVLLKVMKAVQRLVRENPPEYDDEINAIIRDLDLTTLESPTPPPSSPEPPATPTKPQTSKSTPSTPQTARNRGYDVQSPTKVGRVVSWFEAGSLTQGVRGASVRGKGRRNRSHKASAGAYAVFYGDEVGVFEKWADANRSASGHSPAILASFPSVQAAQAALEYARSKGWTADSSPPASASATALAPAGAFEDNPLNQGTTGFWYAICRRVVPGVYRSYLECSLNTSGVRGNLCASFNTRAEAEAAFAQARSGNLLRSIACQSAL